MANRDWTRSQQLCALRLYIHLPFGRLHKTNPDIIAVARQIGRTPDAVAMKASNFASLDPTFRESGRSGLSGASKADKALWDEFTANPELIAQEAEQLAEEASPPLTSLTTRKSPTSDPPAGPTEVSRTVRARRVQSFFRAAVLVSYDSRCALSGISVPELLVASHIIPWSESVERRADPCNGLCLNALLDRAFDRGLITLDERLRTVVSTRLKSEIQSASLLCSLDQLHGRPLQLPTRFHPSPSALEYHRTKVFQA